MENKLIGGRIFLLLLLGVMAFLFINSINPYYVDSSSSSEVVNGIKRDVSVCVYKNDELVQPCFKNLFYEAGQNYTRDLLGEGDISPGMPTNITLCNASAGCGIPVAVATEPFNAFASCGLVTKQGTYYNNAAGNWTIGNTFTASCNDMTINGTRLQTNSTGVNFAGFNFTATTLQSSDTLTVNITSAVS